MPLGCVWGCVSPFPQGQQLFGLMQIPCSSTKAHEPPHGLLTPRGAALSCTGFWGLLPPLCLGESQEPPVRIAALRGCIWSLNVYFWSLNIYLWPPNAMPRCCCWWGWGKLSVFHGWLRSQLGQGWLLGTQLSSLGAFVRHVGSLSGEREKQMLCLPPGQAACPCWRCVSALEMCFAQDLE